MAISILLFPWTQKSSVCMAMAVILLYRYIFLPNSLRTRISQPILWKKNKYWFLFLHINGFNKFDNICVKNTFSTIWYTDHSLEMFPSQTFSCSVQNTNIILAKFAPTSNCNQLICRWKLLLFCHKHCQKFLF